MGSGTLFGANFRPVFRPRMARRIEDIKADHMADRSHLAGIGDGGVKVKRLAAEKCST